MNTAICLGGPLHGQQATYLYESFAAATPTAPQPTREALPPAYDATSVVYELRHWDRGVRDRVPFWVCATLTYGESASLARKFLSRGSSVAEPRASGSVAGSTPALGSQS